MKKGVFVCLVGFFLIHLNGPAWGEGEKKGALDPENFSATLTFTSDYVFRGVSQTDEKPAIQGSFDYAHPVGLYLGIWGSNVDEAISDANLEMDLYVGYRRELFKDFNLDLTGYYYAYPGNEKDPDPEFIELHLGLSYTFSETMLSPTVGLGYNFSPDFYGEDGAAHYVNFTGSLALPHGFNLYAELGFQTVEGDKLTGNGQGMDGGDGFDYTHWKLGISKELLGFKLDAAFHSTGEEEFLGEIGEDRLVFTISRSF